MPLSHLHKDIQPKGFLPYMLGVIDSLLDRYHLSRNFARSNPGTIYGWVDFDPHVADIAIDGRPVARIESHHGTEDVFVYPDHPAADKFVQEALRQGYRPVDTTKPSQDAPET